MNYCNMNPKVDVQKNNAEPLISSGLDVVLREGVQLNRLNSPVVVVPLLAKHSLVIHKFNVDAASPNDPMVPPTNPASLSPTPSP